MKHVGHRIGVGDNRDGAIHHGSLQQQPRILFLFFRLSQRLLKRKAAASEEVVVCSKDFWIAGLVQIKATCIIARPDSESRESYGLRIESLLGRDVEGVSAIGRVRIMVQRELRFGEQGIPSTARLTI